ncbi:hypothetical protein EV356DRAFT_146990 [Viridothelium virens]|uniref:Uncharacterized protein n=1 Tax=Viridothelium virens TaxID=1048519 RepID=A0A6A6H9S3_VIRVR|nr:hypothetical protein EV356DRAFT_146990 [Viridothelium virens]
MTKDCKFFKGLTRVGDPVGPLCSAILAHADDQLKAALLRRSDALEERTFEGYNPLHLAVDWPEGIELLLKNGACSLFNQLDHWRGSVLDHAIKAGNAQSIMLLLDGGCLAVDERNLNWRNLLSLHQGDNASQAIKATIEVLVVRRRALHTYAQVHFSQSSTVFDEGPIRNGASVSRILKALHTARVALPKWISIYPVSEENFPLLTNESVYHNSSLTVEASELLWQKGFFDVNSVGSSGTSPLSIQCTKGRPDVVEWLISKGATLQAGPCSCHAHGSRRVSSFSALPHYLAVCFWQRTRYTFVEQPMIPGVQRQTRDLDWLGAELGQVSRDNCRCACSLSGCIPLLIALKGYRHSSMLTDAIIRLRGHYIMRAASQLQIEVIRYITFDVSRLTHTCCSVDEQCGRLYLPVEEDDVEEICEEERFLIAEFEDVMLEVERLYLQIDDSLPDFLHRQWKEVVMKTWPKTDDDDINKALSSHPHLRKPTSSWRVNYWLRLFSLGDE